MGERHGRLAGKNAIITGAAGYVHFYSMPSTSINLLVHSDLSPSYPNR
jgi:hypothetical protein